MTPVLTSRSHITRSDGSPYVTSESREGQWGQPSVSYYRFTIEGSRMVGTLVSDLYLSSGSRHTADERDALMQEFGEWDVLSDEALLNFEQGLE